MKVQQPIAKMTSYEAPGFILLEYRNGYMQNGLSRLNIFHYGTLWKINIFEVSTLSINEPITKNMF